MKALLIGYGEVGQGIYEAFKYYHDIEIYDPEKGLDTIWDLPIDILLVAIPYSDVFVEQVKEFIQRADGAPAIVFSSVPIGTCKQIPAVHSPIEGDHTNMRESVLVHKRYMGGHSGKAYIFFKQAFCDVVQLEEPDHTEFLKLRSTTIYGINIEFARYSNAVAQKLGMDYQDIKSYDEEYNRLTNRTERPDKQRYILDAPEGRIGGHCIIPNAKLLQKTYPYFMIEYLLLVDKILQEGGEIW
jgi:hypothetical protein